MTQKTKPTDLTTPIRITTTYPPGYAEAPTQSDYVKWGQWLHEEIRNPNNQVISINQSCKQKTETYEIKIFNGRVIKRKTVLNLEPPTMQNKRTLPTGVQPYSSQWYNYMAKEIRGVHTEASDIQWAIARKYPKSQVWAEIMVNRIPNVPYARAIGHLFLHPIETAFALAMIEKETNWGFSKHRYETIKKFIDNFETKYNLKG